MNTLRLFFLFSFLFGIGLVLWQPTAGIVRDDPVGELVLDAVPALGYQAIQPIPRVLPVDETRVLLGKKLFHDPVLSGNGVSCAQCHDTGKNGADGLAVTIDSRGGRDAVNTPTIFNAVFSTRYTWRGHITSLDEQIEAVMANEKHMNADWDRVLSRLAHDRYYANQFKRLFADGLTRDNVKKALIAYEMSLITPDAPFDDFLRGKQDAISEDQKSGYLLFQQYGCISCHQGVNVGGNALVKMGVFSNPFDEQALKTGSGNYDLGLYSVTGKPADRYIFRVPSLRNVEKTAPYFHNGRVDKLEDAIRYMAFYQIGRSMPEEDVRLIGEFLKSLTGRFGGRSL